MKILIINYRYFVSGGPERYLFGVKHLLEKAGHEVIPFSVKYSKNIPNRWDNFFVPPIAREDEVLLKEHSWNVMSLGKAISRAFYSKEVYNSLTNLIEITRPDIAFVLHYLRKLSPSVLTAVKDARLPLVVRLSDFAMLCPESHFFRNNETCELCKRDRLWPSVYYRCVQGSLGVSVVNSFATAYHRWKKYFKLIDFFITPTKFMREKMIEGGWPAEQIHHIPTFVDLDVFRPLQGNIQRVISYTGRVHPTKGITVLLDAFKKIQAKNQYNDIKLKIAGDNDTTEIKDLKCYVDDKEIKNIIFTGALDKQGIARLLSSSLISIVPSRWYENMPNALLESMACGTPVIASDIGSFSEILSEQNGGVLFEAGNSGDLADKITSLISDPQRMKVMSKQARRVAEREYNSELHYQRLMNTFEKVMK